MKQIGDWIRGKGLVSQQSAQAAPAMLCLTLTGSRLT